MQTLETHYLKKIFNFKAHNFKINGTFLSSIVAKRIAFILFLAALIPTTLITGLANQTIESLRNTHLQKGLVEKSQNYGLNVFSHLIFARNHLIQLANLLSVDATNLDQLYEFENTTFRSFTLVNEHQQMIEQSGNPSFQTSELPQALNKLTLSNSTQESQLLLLPAKKSGEPLVAAIAMPFISIGNKPQILVSEINPHFLWGEPEDYPSNMLLCVYPEPSKVLPALFCSDVNGLSRPALLGKSEKIGVWELFLRAEFQHDAWYFETKRLFLTPQKTESLFNNDSFIGIAILSLLMVALMGLIHIRKTMVPLERLMDGTRNIAKGNFTPVKVEGVSEFAQLADSFNGMSSHIQKQLNTMQSLSAIDREMVAKLDVDALIRQVIIRVEQILPATFVSVVRINEMTDTEAQCNIDISQRKSLLSNRMVFLTREINVIKTCQAGRFGECSLTSPYAYETMLSNLQASFYWVLPILWQGKICAFMAIGNATKFDEIADYWEEVRELAGRIGIAISAQAREDQLLIQAQYDHLTGLPNRILLQDRLHQAIEQSNHNGQPFWLLFIDLDRFKLINDSLGHKAGDQLLSAVSKRLQLFTHETDTVARFGGDEFIIILQGQHDEHLRIGVINQLIESSKQPFDIDGNEIFMSASIGISIYPNDAQDADNLLRNADVAMYRAKDFGKNNFQFFTDSMNKKAMDRLLMETHLRKALALNEFKLVYQPKVNLKTRKIVGMEALIRWHCKALGFVSPQQFIGLAEETGLIVAIGEWTIRTACTQAYAWQQAGLDQLLVSVNLSARQFNQKNLVESIDSILKETGLKPYNLELELTESLIMSDVEESMSILHAIKALGVRLSVDDFGTGYSSLSYLKDLPLDTLKIDKSFTDDIVSHTDHVPIVASIILLAKNLNLKVVTEGVETDEQVKYLTAHACDEIQGYYFSRPESAEDFEKLLRSNRTL